MSIILDMGNTTEYSEAYNPDVVTYLALLVLGKNQNGGLFLSDQLKWLVVAVESAAMWLSFYFYFVAHITQAPSVHDI